MWTLTGHKTIKYFTSLKKVKLYVATNYPNLPICVWADDKTSYIVGNESSVQFWIDKVEVI